MDELINGRAVGDIKAALRHCTSEQACIESCPYYHIFGCMRRLITESSELIERLESRIAELEAAQPRWVSVDERLPEKLLENNAAYLTEKVIGTDGEMVCTGQFKVYKLDGHRRFLTGDFSGIITHWMPLPELPEEERDVESV